MAASRIPQKAQDVMHECNQYIGMLPGLPHSSASPSTEHPAKLRPEPRNAG
jgi:hypothetical protein